MTELARELIDGVNIGDFVKIRYGTDQNQDSAEGSVTGLTENFLTLTKADGSRLKIRLDDSLRSLETLSPPAPQNFIPRQPQPAPQNFIPRPTQNFPPPMTPRPIIPVVDSGIKIARKIVPLESAAPYNFVVKDWLEKIRELKQNIYDQKLKRDVNNILASMKTAVKNRDVAYKYHDLRAKILSTWDDCDVDSDYEVFYLMLGVLSVAAKEYAYSFEPLIRAREYSPAAFAAAAAGKNDYAEIFLFCALLSGQEKIISRQVAMVCANKKDIALVEEILNLNRDDEDFCEQVAACAKFMLEFSRVELKTDIDADLSAYETAKKFLDAFPENLKRDSGILDYWHEYQSYEFPAPKIVSELPELDNERLTGKIYSYNTQGAWGFITPEYFFHVGQIYDYTEGGILLRKILSLDLWDQLEVSFSLGESLKYPGRIAASGIELTEDGIATAQKLLATGKPVAPKHTGLVEAFFTNYMNGRIRSNEDGNTYLFKLENIADPWLKAFYRQLNDPVTDNQEVTFEPSGNRALNVCWLNEDSYHHEDCDRFVTDDERDAWQKFLNAQELAQRKPELPFEDPYRNYRYLALPEMKSSPSYDKPAPLVWRKDLPKE